MIKSEIVDKFGPEIAAKIFESRYMQGVTCRARDGELDFYEDDVERAYRDVTGKFVHPMEWD